jgi:RNA polymerase sigma factor (sigma-70 family)
MATVEERLHGIYIAVRIKLHQAVSRMVPPKEVEDIVQETYVRICQVEDKDAIKNPHSFMMRTAQNLALDHIKRAESRFAVSFGDTRELYDDITETNVDQALEQASVNEEFSLLCEAVRQLPLQCRKVYVLKKVYGYSQREIAGKLDLSESTVEKHVANGVKKVTYFMVAHTDAESLYVKLSGRSHTEKGGRR